MGHKDTRMTRRYAHIGPVHLINAVELLEKSYREFSTCQRKRATAYAIALDFSGVPMWILMSERLFVPM